MSELKECPFCGSAGEYSDESDSDFDDNPIEIVSCSNIECPAGELIMTIEEWNRRPLHLDKPAVQEPVEKAKCVWVFDKDGWLTNLGCGENRDMRYTNITDTKVSATPNGFKFCPYCSKQIERKVII